jgi:hypothetical protein
MGIPGNPPGAQPVGAFGPPPPPPPPAPPQSPVYGPGGYAPIGYAPEEVAGERSPRSVLTLVLCMAGLAMPCLFPASIWGLCYAVRDRRTYPRCSMTAASVWLGIGSLLLGVFFTLYFAFIISLAFFTNGAPGGT